jgi:RNA 3'-terminal phosphate cyclase (ATP)
VIKILDIDGNKKSGSGTVLRMSISLAAITGRPLHIYNIRKKRNKPGLRPQHLESVITAAKICNAKVKGASVGSQELWFIPGKIRGGEIKAEIGTAGSFSMLIMTVLPICLFADHPIKIKMSKGGTDVKYAPTINYLIYVFLPILQHMGVKASIEVKKYGYYPKGMGEVEFEVQPFKKLFPIRLEQFGKIREIKGISTCTFLADRRVAERQAEQAKKILEKRGFNSKIRIVNDYSNPFQRGSSILLWLETDSGVILGSDSVGEINKSSEAVAKEAVHFLLDEIKTKATVDVHLADMLIPYMAIAEKSSSYLTQKLTDHLKANIWLSTKFLNADFQFEKKGRLFHIMKRQKK